MSLRLALSTVCILALGGCAATVERTPSATSSGQPASQSMPSMKIPAEAGKRLVLNVQPDPKFAADGGWADFKKEWVDITKEQSAAQGMTFAAQDGAPKATGEQGTLVVVNIKDYRHVTVARRVLLGVMTGNAFIDSKVEFRDLATGKVYGERAYNTTSSAWGGVFAAVTPKQIYALADEIIKEIKQP
jgi:hypothetical protein